MCAPTLGTSTSCAGSCGNAAPFACQLSSQLSLLADVWRRLHPEESSTYTVWSEKTSARAFNQVGQARPAAGYVAAAGGVPHERELRPMCHVLCRPWPWWF